MKKVISVLLIVTIVLSIFTIMPMTVSAKVVDSGYTGDCTWELDENGVMTISGNGFMGGYCYEPLDGFRDENFFPCPPPWESELHLIRSVIIEDGVTNIASAAFEGCNNLASVTIPNSVTSVEPYAFAWCESLTSIEIPDSVTYIDRAFIGNRLTSIKVSDGNTVYDSRENCNAIISTKYNTLIIGCQNTVIPDSVKSIGEKAFYYDNGLTSITIPDSVETIDNEAFGFCFNITKLTIGKNVKTICDSAFISCGVDYRTEAIIPDNVEYIGTDAFGNSCATIFGFKNSYAETYANDNGIPFKEVVVCKKCESLLASSDIEIDKAKPSTCTETGLTEGSHCSVCNEAIKAQEIIPALGHTVVKDEAKPATCTETGLTEGSHCSVCNETLTAQEVVPALGHTVVKDEAKPATCTETGLTEGSHCSVCNEILTAQEVVHALGHTEVVDETKPATCTETGLTEGSHCSVCGIIIMKQRIVNATGHKWDEGKVTKEPTCTEKGVKTFTCENCGETRTEAIEATGHKWDEGKVTKEPTCTEKGVKTFTCENCGETRTEAIEATGHKWDEGKVTKEPTCTEEGVKTFTCENCGETRTEAIDAKGHKWDEGVVTKEPTYKTEGEKLFTCLECGETRTEIIPRVKKVGKLVVSNETAKAGNDVQVKIYLEKNPGISALSFDVEFSDKLTLKDVQYTNLLSSKPTNSKDLSSPFTISWLSSDSKDKVDTGLFATLTFTSDIDVEEKDCAVNVTYKSDNIVDSDLDLVALDIQNGTVSVDNTSTPGDVNRDGVINMKDLVLIQQLINNWDVHIVRRAADVNNDGDINMKDLVILQQYINGWEVELK